MAESSASLPVVGDVARYYPNSEHPLLREMVLGESESSSATTEPESRTDPVEVSPTSTESAAAGDLTDAQAETTGPEKKPDALDWKALLETADPKELVAEIARHERFRPEFQSVKDREVAASTARERARLEADVAQREAAARERERLDSLSPEELGNEVRYKEQIEEYNQQVRREAMNQFMVDGYQRLYEQLGPDRWQLVAGAIQDGRLSGYGEIVAYAADVLADTKFQATLDKELFKRVEERVQAELVKRNAQNHLAEPSPDTTRAVDVPGGRRYSRSEIENMPREMYLKNPKLLAEMEEAWSRGNVDMTR